ncbi:hypothetical protein BIY28_20630 [Brenneria goodwinii]|nr:hypothetical protein BIY28_20630 [Brenneria goodwinii]
MKTDFIMTPLAMPDGSVVNHKLAVDGSSPVIPQANRKTIFPNITKEDLFQMMISVQQSPEAVVKEFAEKYRQRVGAAFAIPTASGTSSLHVPDSGDPRELFSDSVIRINASSMAARSVSRSMKVL